MEERYGYLMKYFEVRKWIGRDTANWQLDRGNLRALHLFVTFTGLNPKKLIKEWMNYSKKARDDITQINHTKHRITAFRSYLIEEIEVAKNSAITYLGKILGFYSDVTGQQVRFTKQEKKIFRRDRGKKRKTPLKVEMIQLLINAMRHNRNKAIGMCLKSSGIPVGDLLALRFKDLEYIEEYGIYLIDFTRVKNEIRYVSFLDQEAAQFLDIYIRTEYPPDHNDDDFVFITLKRIREKNQLKVGDVWDAFRKVTTKVGIKNVTPYTFRRFFTTHMKQEMDPMYVDFMTGHITRAVQAAYDDLINSPRELLLPLYVERVGCVQVFQSTDPVAASV